MAFEVKSPKGKLTDAQSALLERLKAQGVLVAVVRSQEDVQASLSEWGIETRGQVQ